jgi:hypothetical protein
MAKASMATKVRKYMVKHPNATVPQIMEATGAGKQQVYNIRWAVNKAKADKKIVLNAAEVAIANKAGVSTVEYAKQRLKLRQEERKTKRKVKPTIVQKHYGVDIDKNMPKVGDSVGGLTLTRRTLPDNTHVYRWVHDDAVKSGKVLVDTPASDNVNHPAHYKVGGIETIDFIEAKSLGYNLGNVVKYITRADHKGNRSEDLLKARWYLNREIAKLSGETK